MCVSSLCHLPHLECLNPSDQSDLDDIEDVVDNEFLSFSNHSLGKVKETEVIEASGLSDAYYTPSPRWANGVMVDSQSCHPQTHLSEGNSSGD